MAIRVSQYTECQRAILIKPPLQAAKNSSESMVPSWSVSISAKSVKGANVSLDAGAPLGDTVSQATSHLPMFMPDPGLAALALPAAQIRTITAQIANLTSHLPCTA